MAPLSGLQERLSGKRTEREGVLEESLLSYCLLPVAFARKQTKLLKGLIGD